MREELVAQDFYFYTDGQYRNQAKWDSNLGIYDNDVVKCDGAKIRIFGTKIQINEELDKYIKKTGLALDECFNFKVEPPGSYWNKILDITPAQNQKVKQRLNEYRDLYNNNDKKPILMRLI